MFKKRTRCEKCDSIKCRLDQDLTSTVKLWGLGRCHLIRGDGLLGLGVLEIEVVLAILVELRGGNVHADLDLASVSRLVDGLDEEGETLKKETTPP